MKEIFKKISAIFMAFVVLLSTLSFTIHEHYCGDELMDTSLFSKDLSCEMYMEMPMSSAMTNGSVEKDNCCDDILYQIEGQSELQTDFSTFDFNQHIFVASFVYSYLNLFEGLDENIVPFKYYSPPLLVKDIQVLDEVFII